LRQKLKNYLKKRLEFETKQVVYRSRRRFILRQTLIKQIIYIQNISKK